MQHSQDLDQIFAALAKFQGEVGTIERTKEANIPTKSGRNIRFTYADLSSIWEAIRKPLAKHGLSVSQVLSSEGNISYIHTLVGHSSGQYISSKLAMRLESIKMTDLGSAITYLRRYTLSSALGLVTDDDVDAQPEMENYQGVQRISPEQCRTIDNLFAGREDIRAAFLKAYKLETLSDIPATEFADKVAQVQKRMAKENAQGASDEK